MVLKKIINTLLFRNYGEVMMFHLITKQFNYKLMLMKRLNNHDD